MNIVDGMGDAYGGATLTFDAALACLSPLEEIASVASIGVVT
jgi:hypothetical protein